MAFIQVLELRKMTAGILQKCDVPVEQADIIADTVVYAHIHGKETHGITRLPIYVRKIKEGLMKADTNPVIKMETPVVCVLDAQDGFGQIAAYEGMKRCIENAGKFGIGACGVCNSNNFGVAAYFAEMAVKRGMVGMVASASAPAIAPTGGKKPLFGTNPICIGFPVRKGKAPIILDMAASEAARGKIRLAQKNEEKIPFGWALDEDGRPTNDPAEALAGTMVPIGGYKGYGIALAVDILCGLLTGSAFGGEIKPLNDPDAPSRQGHVMMAIDISKLMPYESYLGRVDVLAENIYACGEPGMIRVPGERSYFLSQHNCKDVEIREKQMRDFRQLALQLGVAID